jgi:hypothetical protein
MRSATTEAEDEAAALDPDHQVDALILEGVARLSMALRNPRASCSSV